ncbi:MAG: PAS domain S-box protein [Sedimentisphaerales bacterium]
MRDSKSSEKKPVQEIQTPRQRKPKLERVNCDTIERKRSEEKLLSERNKLWSVFEAMEDGVYIVNQQHDIQYVNPVIKKDFGPWQGCKCYQYFHDRKKPCPWCKNEQVFAGKTVRWEWYSFKNRKTYDLIDTPLKNPDGSLSKLEIFRDITERKKMEEQLEQSREFLANTINALDDTFFVKDEEHKWTILNDAACEAIGRPREELIGKSDYDLFPKEQADVFREKDNLVFETGKTSINEEEVTWQGKLHTISTKKSLFKDSITGKRFIVGTARDITERRQMEKTLRESEQKYRALVEQSSYGIVILQDYRIVFANKAAAEIPGLTMEKLQSLSLEDMMAFVPPEDRAATLERLKNRFARKNEPGNYELRLVRRNGEEFWLNLFFSNIEYQGKFAIQLAFVDITDQKRMEEALRRSEIQFREIFENTPVGVYRTTPDGRVLMANPALVHMLGFSSFEELSQRNLEEEGFEPQYRRSIFREEIERKGRIVSWESIWTTQDGKNLHVIENARIVRDEDGRILYYEGTAENITERKKAEEALTESEEKFRNLSEQSPNMIFINKRGRVVYANKKCEEVMGYKREEFYHPDFDFMTLIAPEFRQFINTNLSRHIKGEEIKPYEYGLITKNGEKLDAIITTRLMKYDGENSILGTITDITERKQTEEKLRVREQTLRAFLNAPTESAILVDTEGTILEINRIAAQRLGKSAEELIGMGIYDYLPADIAESRKARGVEVIRSGKPLRFQDERAGRYYDNNIYPVFDDEGKVSAFGVFSGDITENKQAQEALKESEEKYRAIVERATDSIVTVDLKGIITSCNTALLEQTGYSEQDFVGRHFTKNPTMRTKDIPKYLKIFMSLVAGKVPGPLELVGIYKDGSEHLGEVHISIIRKRGKIIGFQAMTRDITERKQAEEKLREYQEQLKSLASELTLAEERERHRIATELHDEISQSLFISKMKLEEIQKSGSGKTFDDTLDEINNSLGRIIAAMRSLTFDLSSPILYEFGFEEAVAEWLNEQVEKKHGIATEFEDDGLPKPLDDDIRVILFRNVRELLINVVKHARAKKIKVSIQKVGSRIRVSVEDDGVGFDSTKAESLIISKEAFGLFSIRERLEHLGGNLEIMSSPGCGCRVTITSPLSREEISKDKQA